MTRPLPGASVQKLSSSRKSRKVCRSPAAATPHPPANLITTNSAPQCDLKSCKECSEIVKKCFNFVVIVALDNKPSELHAPDIVTWCGSDDLLSSSEVVVTQAGSCHIFAHLRNFKIRLFKNIISFKVSMLNSLGDLNPPEPLLAMP